MDRSRASRKSSIFLVLTLAVMAFIFVHSAMPADLSGAESGRLAVAVARLLGRGGDPAAVELIDMVVRKIAHFLEFLALGLCLMMALRSAAEDRARAAEENRIMGRLSMAHLGGMAWLIGAAYAVTDEIHQIFVPGRSGQVKDVLLDAAGVLAGVVIAAAVARKNV